MEDNRVLLTELGKKYIDTGILQSQRSTNQINPTKSKIQQKLHLPTLKASQLKSSLSNTFKKLYQSQETPRLLKITLAQQRKNKQRQIKSQLLRQIEISSKNVFVQKRASLISKKILQEKQNRSLQISKNYLNRLIKLHEKQAKRYQKMTERIYNKNN